MEKQHPPRKHPCIAARHPDGILIGEFACVRAFQSCEEFHQGCKTVTMTDETTFSHLFRFPNSFLEGGKPFGEALAEKILEIGIIGEDAPNIVDVGGGLGDVSKKALPVFLRSRPRLTWTEVDLSPALLESQEKALADIPAEKRFIHGNAEDLPAVVSNIDLLLSNEVLADLTAITHLPINANVEDKMNAYNMFAEENSRWWSTANEYIRKYGLNVHYGGIGEDVITTLNYGALKMVETLPQVLSQTGSAFFTEYASMWGNQRKRLRGHEEYTLNSEHFIKVAEANGFRVESGTFTDLLGIDPNMEYVEPKHINLWLMLGEDPRVVSQRGDAGEKQAMDAAWRYAAEPEKYTVFDWALTPTEFARLSEERGWNIRNPMTEKIGEEANKYMYFALTRK